MEIDGRRLLYGERILGGFLGLTVGAHDMLRVNMGKN